MRVAFFLVPGRLDGATGGYVYDRRIVCGLRDAGWTIHVRELDGAFPNPSRDTLERASSVLASVPDDEIVIVDGLAFAAMPDVVVMHANRLRFVALVHLPQACDVTLSVERRRERERDERHALRCAARIVVTGSASAAALGRYGIGRDRIAIVEPGTDTAQPSRGSGGASVHVLCVATVNAIKGHDLLIRSLGRIHRLPWHLTCAGSLTRDARAAARLEEAIAQAGLAERVRLTGELTSERLERCYDEADVFALATHFETYGMAVAEALAHGLPVVSTWTGAIPVLVGNDAGLLVSPGDENAFADALQRAIADPELRGRMRRAAAEAATRLLPWPVAVRKFSEVLAEVADIA